VYCLKIIPPLLVNIGAQCASELAKGNRTERQTQKVLEAQEEANYAAFVAQRRVSIFDDVITGSELAQVAISSLQRLVRAASASSIGIVIVPVLEFLEANGKWEDIMYSTLILRSITSASSVCDCNLFHFAVRDIIARRLWIKSVYIFITFQQFMR
jgi:hypothetical protein